MDANRSKQPKPCKLLFICIHQDLPPFLYFKHLRNHGESRSFSAVESSACPHVSYVYPRVPETDMFHGNMQCNKPHGSSNGSIGKSRSLNLCSDPPVDVEFQVDKFCWIRGMCRYDLRELSKS